MKIVLNFIKYFTIVFYVILIMWEAIMFIEAKFKLDDHPNVAGLIVLKVKTGSMDPTIKGNDYIMVSKTDAEDVKINDIVTYDDSSNYVTHRVVGIDGDVYELKGDANNASEKISSIQIFAKVIIYGSWFTNLMNFVKNPVFLILFGMIGLLLPEIFLNKINKKS